jgi:hypothetical protein
VYKKQENIAFDSSALDFVIKNPLPKVFSCWLKALGKLVSSFSANKGRGLLASVKNKI